MPISKMLSGEDGLTPKAASEILYRFLTDTELNMPEVNVMNASYEGNADRPGFIFGSDLYAASYGGEDGTIPPYDEFKKAYVHNNCMAGATASFDPEDQDRVSLQSINTGRVQLIISVNQESDVDKMDALIERLMK